MITYIIRRFIHAIVVIWVVTMMVFLGVHFLPGDPVLMYMTQDDLDAVSPEEIAALRHEFGLDRPIFVQYFDWIAGAVRGDLGRSIFFGTTVSEEIGRALPVSIYISLLAWIISHTVGPVAGLICAVRRGKWQDTFLTSMANMGNSIPIFWFAILLIYLFGLKLGWFPIQGYTSPFENFTLSARQLIMPTLAMSITHLAGGTRQTRSSMLEVLRQDYIRTAWSKGLKERTIVLRHALKNGIIPVVTLSGMSIPSLFGGTVFIENVFNIPGMGRLSVAALFTQDYAIVQGVILVIATVIVLANMLVDISYGWLNPRVRIQ
jgi:peptide/nickel transport system permease protein